MFLFPGPAAQFDPRLALRQDHALEEVAKWMREVVEEIPLGNACLPKGWIPDRVNAARVSC